jgi:hypothetical protein
LREECGVALRRENSPEAENGREIDRARDAVLKSKIQAIIAERSYLNDIL